MGVYNSSVRQVSISNTAFAEIHSDRPAASFIARCPRSAILRYSYIVLWSQGFARWRCFSAAKMGRMGGGARLSGVLAKCCSKCRARLTRHLWYAFWGTASMHQRSSAATARRRLARFGWRCGCRLRRRLWGIRLFFAIVLSGRRLIRCRRREEALRKIQTVTKQQYILLAYRGGRSRHHPRCLRRDLPREASTWRATYFSASAC